MKSVEKKRRKLRICIVGLFFVFFFSVIGIKAIYLQAFCPWLNDRALEEREKSLIFRGKRGTIYDANGREMAVTSADVESITAHPRHIKDPRATAQALSRALQIDAKTLNVKLESGKSFIWVKRQVGPRKSRTVKDLRLKGVGFISEHSRFYPSGTLAAQVLGFTGVDDRGLEGIEFYYDNWLKGSDHKLTVLKDGFDRKFDTEENTDMSYSGKNLILTIDKTIQFITESALEEAVTDFSAKSGMAVVMEPDSGAVLALAHAPVFNPNSFGKFDRDLWRNKAVTDPFEPGSTMKIFSAAGAIEFGGCTPDTIFFCENGAYQIGEDVVHDSRPYGWMSLGKIIKYSSNIGSVKVSEMIGPQLLYKTLRDFGFGEKTRIDCPGETAGTLSFYRRWSKIDAGTISFGQGISVSAIQLITATSAIANGGMLMKPYIVQAITNSNGQPVESFGPRKIRRVVSAETAEAVRQMMKSVVEKGGTGEKAALKGYSACGKTGTAQKIDGKGQYAKGKYVASFIGFAPAEKTRVVILAVLDEPQKNHYGGTAATPVFRKIAYETLNYMNVPPRHEKKKLTASVAGDHLPMIVATVNGSLSMDHGE